MDMLAIQSSRWIQTWPTPAGPRLPGQYHLHANKDPDQEAFEAPRHSTILLPCMFDLSGRYASTLATTSDLYVHPVIDNTVDVV